MYQFSVYFFFVYMLFALILAYFFVEKWSRRKAPVYFFWHKPKKVKIAYLKRVGREWRQGQKENQRKEHNWVNQILKWSFGKSGPIPILLQVYWVT